MPTRIPRPLTVGAVLFVVAASTPAAQTSTWVFQGPDGRLQYQTDSQGNGVMDFSYAGYLGGGVALPDVPVQQTVDASGSDDTAAIQAAIDAVSALLPDSNGFRGAVLLTAGVFNCAGPLRRSAHGGHTDRRRVVPTVWALRGHDGCLSALGIVVSRHR